MRLPAQLTPFTDPTYQGLPWLHDGMGDLGSAGSSQINAIVTTGASTTVGILAALSVIPGPGWVAGAIAGLIEVSSLVVNMFQGCGQTCVVATGDANQVGAAMAQNLNAYMSAPVHTQSLQKAALNNFDTMWAALVAACSNPTLGAAGQRCITDRQQGSCAYKTTPGGWQQSGGTWKYVYPGANNSGDACWNWFVGNRDPIANDPTVVPDSAIAIAPTATSATPGTTASTTGATTDTPASVPGDFFGNITPLEWALFGVAAFLLLGSD